MIIIMGQISTCIAWSRELEPSKDHWFLKGESKETPISFAMAWFKMYIPLVHLSSLLVEGLFICNTL